MNAMTPQPFVVLVDDDFHSARLLSRMLVAHGAPVVDLKNDADIAISDFVELLASPRSNPAGMVVVDLKESSKATAEFIARLRQIPGSAAVVIAAMAPSLDRETRDALLEAGANAVFERHAELALYRQEAASMVRFWVRHQRLDAVGS